MPVRVVQTTTLATTLSSAKNLDAVVLNVHVEDQGTRWHYNRTGNGSIAANVQYTLDNVLEAGVSAVWIDSVTLTTAASAGSITHPAAAVRLRITAASGANSIAFRVLQAGV